MSFTEKILQRSYILLNLFFIVYVWQIQPSVLKRLIAVSQSQQKDLLIGLLILSVPIIEIIGVVLKRPVSAYLQWHYPRTEGSTWDLVTYLFAAICHIGAAALLVIVGFEALRIGFDANTPGGMQGLLFAVFMLILFKEAFFVVLIVPSSMTSLLQQLNQKDDIFVSRRLSPPKSITLWLALRNLLGEFFILIYSALLFTCLWEFLCVSQIDGVFDYFGVSFFYIWIFLAARTTSIMEGLGIQNAPNQKWWSLLTGVAIWLVTMLTLPRY